MELCHHSLMGNAGEGGPGDQKENRARTVKDRRARFIEHQNTCPLCNSNLEIYSEITSRLMSSDDYVDIVREEARCPKCHVPARIKDHRLQ